MKKDFMFYTIFLSIVLAVVLVFDCCEQYVTRQWGGSSTIRLSPGEKLIEVTWKGDGDLWYLTEPMDSDYLPKVKVFKENSLMGVCEGEVVFIETR